MKETIRQYHYAILTPREHKALVALISEAEAKHTRDLRLCGMTTQYINKAISKIKNSTAK